MEVIFEGSLCNGQETFYVIPLSIIHIEKILDLQEIVIDALEDKICYSHYLEKNLRIS